MGLSELCDALRRLANDLAVQPFLYGWYFPYDRIATESTGGNSTGHYADANGDMVDVQYFQMGWGMSRTTPQVLPGGRLGAGAAQSTAAFTAWVGVNWVGENVFGSDGDYFSEGNLGANARGMAMGAWNGAVFGSYDLFLDFYCPQECKP